MKTLLTCRVANIQGEKVVVVGSKISQGLHSVLKEIEMEHDRTMSYVLRELATRGLAQYYLDGNIKATPEEDAIISRGGVNGMKLAPRANTNILTPKKQKQRKTG